MGEVNCTYASSPSPECRSGALVTVWLRTMQLRSRMACANGVWGVAGGTHAH